MPWNSLTMKLSKNILNLGQVEKAFRISKSDLKIRPVFHTARESIESHLLLVFTAFNNIQIC